VYGVFVLTMVHLGACVQTCVYTECLFKNILPARKWITVKIL
jgi:hypothetical protein